MCNIVLLSSFVGCFIGVLVNISYHGHSCYKLVVGWFFLDNFCIPSNSCSLTIEMYMIVYFIWSLELECPSQISQILVVIVISTAIILFQVAAKVCGSNTILVVSGHPAVLLGNITRYGLSFYDDIIIWIPLFGSWYAPGSPTSPTDKPTCESTPPSW